MTTTRDESLSISPSLLIPRGCAVGFDGLVRSYQGITIPIEELSISAPFSKALTIDVFENIPPIIRKTLRERSAFYRPSTVDVNASPMKESDIDFRTCLIIAVCSQGYNVVTNYCTSWNLCQLHIANNGSEIHIVRGKNRGEIIRRASSQYDIAILEKVIDQTQNGTTIIISACLGVVGTMGAIQYLLDHWRDLDKSYGKREFALVLQFGPMGTQPLQEMLKGNVIRRMPEN